MIDALVTAVGIGVGIAVGLVALKLLGIAACAAIVVVHEWRQPDDDVIIVYELDPTEDYAQTYVIDDDREPERVVEL